MERKTKACIAPLIVLLIIMVSPASDICAQCYGPMMLSPNFFEFDYLVRLAVHFGDEYSLPDHVICSREMTEADSRISFPIWAYNLHEGVERLEFAVQSNDSIAGFSPENCFWIKSSSVDKDNGSFYMELILEACQPVCGPALVGYVEVIPAEGSDPVWLDIVSYGETRQMLATDLYGETHYLFSPQHGGYVGSGYLYACQPPLCEEPNSAVLDLEAELTFGCSVKLTWIAGGGNTTVIVYREDRYPTGYNDGEIVVEMPSVPGEPQFYYHTEAPNYTVLYYKAFSLTKSAGGEVINSSFVECSSSDEIYTDCLISVESTTWGGIKKKFR